MNPRRLHMLIAVSLIFFSITAAQAQPGWSRLDTGVVNDLHAIHFNDASHGWAVGSSGVGIKTTDAGASWQLMTMGTNIDLHGVSFAGAVGVAVGDGGVIVRSTDSGDHWGPVSSGVSDGLLSVTLNGNGGVCGGLSQTILYSANAGATWIISQTGFFGGGFAGTSMVSPQIAFVGGTNSIFQPLAGKSTDGGAHWDFHPFYLSGNEGDINAIDFTDANIGYAACRVWDGTGAIARTANGGQAWSTTLVLAELNGIDFPISDAGLVGYAVGAAGTILKTGNAGGSWHVQTSGVTDDLRSVSFVDFENGFAAGDRGTILKTTTGGESGSSAVDGVFAEDGPRGSDARPSLRAFPSPFSGATRISYGAGGGMPRSIMVFDAGGQRVRTLGSGSARSGMFVWDGRDDAGRPLAAGVYLIAPAHSPSGGIKVVLSR